MNFISVLGLILKYGPQLIRLAISIHNAIEDFAKRQREDPSFHAFTGEKPTSKDKRMRHDVLLKARAPTLRRARELKQAELDEIREGVWRAKNRKKARAQRKKAGKAR